MDIVTYLKNSPIDYNETKVLLNSSAPLGLKDLDKLNVLCLDYRLQQLNSQKLSDILLYATQELAVRKVMFKYETLPSIVDAFDFLFLCAITDELDYYKKIINESKYKWVLDFSINKSEKNLYKEIWGTLVYYFYCKFTNTPVDMSIIATVYTREKLTEATEQLSKLSMKNPKEVKYQAMICSGYILLAFAHMLETYDCWAKPSVYFTNEEKFNVTFDNVITTLSQVNFIIEPIIIEYVKKLLGKLIIFNTLNEDVNN